MRRYRLPKLMGLIAILAVVLAWCRPMSKGDAVRMATTDLEESHPGFDLDHHEVFPQKQRWFSEGRKYVSWLVDFRRKGEPGGILYIIDYPEDPFNRDVGWIEYASRDSRGFVPSPDDPGPIEWINSRGRR